MLEEKLGGAVQLGPARGFGLTLDFNQLALHQRGDHAIDCHAANLFHLGTGDRLPVGHDSQRLKCRLGQLGRTRLGPDEYLQPRGKVRPCHELPVAAHAGQAIASVGVVVFDDQFLECLLDRTRGGGGKFARVFSSGSFSGVSRRTVRSSPILIGFCAEKTIDSSISFSSTLLRFHCFRHRLTGHDPLHVDWCDDDFYLAEHFALRGKQML